MVAIKKYGFFVQILIVIKNVLIVMKLIVVIELVKNIQLDVHSAVNLLKKYVNVIRL